VPTDDDGRVLEFLEKTEDPPTNQINAGCYVFKKDLIATIPENRVVSVERETFPGVLEEGYKVFGHVDNSYWRDMGRPDDFVRGSSDLVRGIAHSPLLEGKTGESLVDPSAGVAGGVLLLSGTSVGRGSEIGAGCRLDGTVIFDGVTIEPGAHIANSIIASGARIGANAHIEDCVIGEGALIGARCELLNGMRIFPGVDIPDAGVRFSSDA
uniref:NDP-sugar synthase n=3 Tax=Corynebacteriaceae TaxID=1653 RepID=UPI00263BD0F6